MTTRASHKARGKGFETALLKLFRLKGWLAERLALAGARDEGDLIVANPQAHLVTPTTEWILEAKAPGAGNAIDLSGWLREADTERDNYAAARGIDPSTLGRAVVIKARGKSIEEAYVVTRLSDWFPENLDNQGNVS